MSKGDFYSEAHRKIFNLMVELSEKNEPVDLITLSNALRDRKMLDSVGGTAYLASLVDNVPSAANVANYAKIVKEKAILRGLIGSATEIITSCYETGSDVDQVLDQAEHSIFEIAENKVRPSFYPIREIVKDSFRSIEDLYARKELITGVPTGFEKIDDLTSGLQKSDLIIIAGRPSMGKTAFALNIAQFAALEASNTCCCFFSGNVQRAVGISSAGLGSQGRFAAFAERFFRRNRLAEIDDCRRPSFRSAAFHR